MNRTGEELYNIYKGKMEELGCIVDDWWDIEQVDRAAWCLLAEELMNEGNNGQ